MTDAYDFDLFVIGAGSGGVRAARMSAGYGARVAVAEEARLGGTCVNVGCIPKKLLVYGSGFRKQVEISRSYGWDASVQGCDWATMIANKDREIARLNDIYGKILDRAGVRRISGRATLLDAHTVEVAGERFSARYILIAVGGRPYKPPVEGGEHTIVSDQAFTLPALPERIMVAGAGYIGVEFAGIFRGFGADVTLVHRRELVLRGFDRDLREGLTQQLTKRGIKLRLGTLARRFVKQDDGSIEATFDNGDTQRFDLVLCATGRRPYTRALGLEQAGVTTDDRGAIIVDEYSRTNVESIYAVGDVTDRMNLTPVALAEGMAVAATLFDDRPTRPNYANVPTAVFSQPELATVGLTESEARAQHDNVVIYRSRFRPLKLSLTDIDDKVMMKLVVDGDSDKVLGVHVMGEAAAEIVQGFAVALQCGATKKQLDSTIGIHPSAAEELVTMRTPVQKAAS